MKIVIASLYSCAHVEGSFDKEHAKLQRENAKVSQYSVDSINGNTEINGKFYVVHDELTKLYHAGEWPLKEEPIQEAEIVENEQLDAPIGDWKRPRLIDYLTENNVDFKGNHSDKKLIELVTEHKTK